MARLQREFCTKDFFSSHEFSYERCSEIFPEIFEPLFCGSEKIPGKFPPNFPLNFPNFPAKNQKKFTDELLQERRENKRRMSTKKNRNAPKRPRNILSFFLPSKTFLARTITRTNRSILHRRVSAGIARLIRRSRQGVRSRFWCMLAAFA